MRTQNKINRKPIYCDECSRLALAVFDGQNLCAHCLIHAENLDLFTEGVRPIMPLPITTDEFGGAFGIAS